MCNDCSGDTHDHEAIYGKEMTMYIESDDEDLQDEHEVEIGEEFVYTRVTYGSISDFQRRLVHKSVELMKTLRKKRSKIYKKFKIVVSSEILADYKVLSKTLLAAFDEDRLCSKGIYSRLNHQLLEKPAVKLVCPSYFYVGKKEIGQKFVKRMKSWNRIDAHCSHFDACGNNIGSFNSYNAIFRAENFSPMWAVVI